MREESKFLMEKHVMGCNIMCKSACSNNHTSLVDTQLVSNCLLSAASMLKTQEGLGMRQQLLEPHAVVGIT